MELVKRIENKVDLAFELIDIGHEITFVILNTIRFVVVFSDNTIKVI